MSYFKTYKCPQCKKGDLIPAYKIFTLKGRNICFMNVQTVSSPNT